MRPPHRCVAARQLHCTKSLSGCNSLFPSANNFLQIIFPLFTLEGLGRGFEGGAVVAGVIMTVGAACLGTREGRRTGGRADGLVGGRHCFLPPLSYRYLFLLPHDPPLALVSGTPIQYSSPCSHPPPGGLHFTSHKGRCHYHLGCENKKLDLFATSALEEETALGWGWGWGSSGFSNSHSSSE